MATTIILIGSPASGYNPVGPFTSEESAMDFGTNNLGNESWETMSMQSQEEYVQENAENLSSAVAPAASDEDLEDEDEE